MFFSSGIPAPARVGRRLMPPTILVQDRFIASSADARDHTDCRLGRVRPRRRTDRHPHECLLLPRVYRYGPRTTHSAPPHTAHSRGESPLVDWSFFLMLGHPRPMSISVITATIKRARSTITWQGKPSTGTAWTAAPVRSLKIRTCQRAWNAHNEHGNSCGFSIAQLKRS